VRAVSDAKTGFSQGGRKTIGRRNTQKRTKEKRTPRNGRRKECRLGGQRGGAHRVCWSDKKEAAKQQKIIQILWFGNKFQGEQEGVEDVA